MPMSLLVRSRQILSQVYQFIYLVIKRFFDNDGLYRASALSFTTLLALVPLMSVSFTVLSAFPNIRQLHQPIQDFIFSNFVPATGKVVQSYLQTFANQASQLSVVGLFFLVISAVMMLFTIEQAMNQIWRVRTPRSGVSAFLLYWAVLTLTPILMGVSIAVSSYLKTLPFLTARVVDEAITQAALLRWLPFILETIALTLLFVAVPNRKVALRHGLFGALITAFVIEIAKYVFTLYITSYHTYELLYGAFATIPIFFLWVYTVWMIVLIGAEIAHGVSVLHEQRVAASLDPFTHAIRWLGHLYVAQKEGRSLSLLALISSDVYSYDIDPDEQIAQLIKAKMIRITTHGNYVLCRDLTAMTFAELSDILPWKIPSSKTLTTYNDPWIERLSQHLQALEKAGHQELQKPVASYFQ